MKKRNEKDRVTSKRRCKKCKVATTTVARALLNLWECCSCGTNTGTITNKDWKRIEKSS